MDIEARLELFRNMIGCCHELYYWDFDGFMELRYTNCPYEITAASLFNLGRDRNIILAAAEKHVKPIIVSNDLGLSWVAVSERDEDGLSAVHVLGPMYIDGSRAKDIELLISSLGLSQHLRKELGEFLSALPSITISRVFEYAIMLYYCITGEKIGVSDMHYRDSSAMGDRVWSETVDAHGTYAMEQEMLRMVREGNLNYKSKIDRIAISGRVGQLSNGDPIRQAKNAIITCITLFSRAAIEGGVSPEVALTVSDKYYQAVEACDKLHELAEVCQTMQDDYVRRVHRIRTSGISRQVLQICDYIDMHLEDELTLPKLADMLSYSDSYLSHKFKDEVGISIRDYVRKKRLERAKELMGATDMTVTDIATKLNFCSQSYFSAEFKKEYGINPSAWRDKIAEEETK